MYFDGFVFRAFSDVSSQCLSHCDFEGNPRSILMVFSRFGGFEGGETAKTPKPSARNPKHHSVIIEYIYIYIYVCFLVYWTPLAKTL